MRSISHDHADRDEIKRRAEEDFLGLYLEHGGVRRWKSLKCLFHEDSTPSASIHKGRFHCFGCGVSLDIIEFVQRVRGDTFKEALAFLGARYAVPLDGHALTAQEKREYARRRAAAEMEAAELVAWKGEMLEALRQERNVYFHGYHKALRSILRHGLEGPMGNLAADVADRYETRYLELDRRIERVSTATYAELVPFFRARDRRAAA